MSVRIVLVDDHGMFRSGVRAELATDPGIEVVAEAADVAGAVADRACPAARRRAP